MADRLAAIRGEVLEMAGRFPLYGWHEQILPFALRAEVEGSGVIWQRQQLAQQRDIVVIPCARCEQRQQLAELLFDQVVAGEPGGAFELDDERIERTVLVVRRAEIAQARMRLGFNAFGQRRR